MAKLLADKYSGIPREENCHDRLLPESDKTEFPSPAAVSSREAVSVPFLLKILFQSLSVYLKSIGYTPMTANSTTA